MPFSHSLRLFPPIYNRGRKKKVLLESFEQKARLSTQEHPPKKVWRRAAGSSTIFQLQTSSISDTTIGFSPKNIVATKSACIFHTPKGCVHMRKSRTFVLERNRVEESKGIDIEIERFCGDGIRVATRSELMKQIGFGSLGKSNSRHKMRNKEQTEKKATQVLRKECKRVFHKWHIRKFAE